MAEWLERMRASIRGISQSSTAAVIYEQGEPDPQQALEIGAILLMGKPLILIVQPGGKAPAGLVRAAEAILEWHPDPEVMAKRVRDVLKEQQAKGEGPR